MGEAAGLSLSLLLNAPRMLMGGRVGGVEEVDSSARLAKELLLREEAWLVLSFEG